MKDATMYQHHEEKHSSSKDPSNSELQPESQRNAVLSLKILASKLMHEVESLNEVHSLDINDGVDFYDEVTEFEIGLIRRALTHTRGHQGRAARLLNLKVTTLNSKIKQYKIQVDAFARGYSLIDNGDLEVRQHV
jgi:DNA-binding NtrC family response regulator